VDFTCPHCGKTFYAPTRKGSKSEKVKEAARRNGALGGGPPKVSVDAVRAVYLQKPLWTWQEFVVALKKKTGMEYSRARAFVLLKQLKEQEQPPTQTHASTRISSRAGRTVYTYAPDGKKKTAQK